ncbi:MAG TPA: DUF4177 domain-containing protein [Ktedonobacteraceae bacterium]
MAQKWEYMTVNMEAKGWVNKRMNEKGSMELLNKMGDEGWELVSVVPIERTQGLIPKTDTHAFAFILKRQKS